MHTITQCVSLCLWMAGYQLSSHLLSLAAGLRWSQMCLELCYRQLYSLSGILKQEMNRSWTKKQSVISCYKLDNLGFPWEQFESSLWFKKSTLAIQEFLESGANEVYHNPQRQQRVSWNLTRKYGSQLDLKLSTQQMFVRIWRLSLQTLICLKAEWGQIYGRH